MQSLLSTMGDRRVQENRAASHRFFIVNSPFCVARSGIIRTFCFFSISGQPSRFFVTVRDGLSSRTFSGTHPISPRSCVSRQRCDYRSSMHVSLPVVALLFFLSPSHRLDACVRGYAVSFTRGSRILLFSSWPSRSVARLVVGSRVATR